MDIVLRAAFMFVVLFLLLRVMGKRELAQMTPFDMVVLIVLGDLVQQGVTHNDFSVTAATLAVVTFAFLAVVMGWLTYRFPSLEPLLEGSPRVLVRDGDLLEGQMRRDRITRREIESEMRLTGIAHIADVRWAILEPNGKISFIERDKALAASAEQD